MEFEDFKKFINEKEFYHFHIGIGKNYRYGGYRSFVSVVSEEEITKRLSLIERDSKGRYYNMFISNHGHEVIGQKELQDAIKSGHVVLDFDTVYDTDVYLFGDMLTQEDVDLISKSGYFDYY